MDKSEVTLEQAEQLFEFLSNGSVPDGFHFKSVPKIGAKKAFSVIYYLQERLHLIPDHYELCCVCHRLFDDWQEGHYDEKKGKHYCDSCRWD